MAKAITTNLTMNNTDVCTMEKNMMVKTREIFNLVNIHIFDQKNPLSCNSIIIMYFATIPTLKGSTE